MAVGGGSGTILTSTDGTSWTSGTTVELYDITYVNNAFVVVGSAGEIVTSSDGISWTYRTSDTSNRLNGVTYFE